MVENPFSDKQKVLFLPNNSTKGFITVTNLKKERWLRKSESSPLSFQIYDCPSIMKNRVKLILDTPKLRDQIQSASENLWAGTAKEADLKIIVGNAILNYVGETNLSKSQHEGLALQISELYITLARPYFPQDFLSRMLRKADRKFR